MIRSAAIAFLLVTAPRLLEAQSSPADTTRLVTFLSQLQRASAADDRGGVAALLRYPITISIGGLRVPFSDAASVIARYDDIFNPTLRDAIANASVSQNVVVGANDIVIAEVDGQLRITGITVPHDTTSTASTGSAGTTPGSERKPEPRRVSIRVGPRPTQVAGLLARNTTDSWMLFLPKGTLASVRLERAPVGTAVIRVIHARTGMPLSARAAGDARFVSGRAPADADYRIDVQHTGNGEDAHIPYMLSVSFR